MRRGDVTVPFTSLFARTDFDNKNGSFDEDGFIWESKDIRDGNSHLRYQKDSFT